MTLRTLGWDQLNLNRLEQLNRAIRQFAFGELLSIPAKALSPRASPESVGNVRLSPWAARTSPL